MPDLSASLNRTIGPRDALENGGIGMRFQLPCDKRNAHGQTVQGMAQYFNPKRVFVSAARVVVPISCRSQWR